MTERFQKTAEGKRFEDDQTASGRAGGAAESSGQHLTAEEIYERIKAANPDIGLATVIGQSQLLLELGLIDRINLDDGFARYEIGDVDGKRRHHRHHHLIC